MPSSTKNGKDADRTTDPELLRQFEQETRAKVIRDTKLGSIVASVGFPLFGLLDYALYPGIFIQLILIRAAVVVASLVIFLMIQTRIGQRFPRFVAMLEYFVCGLSIVLMVHVAEGYLSPYYAGINLVLLSLLFILPLDARRTAIVCAILYACYIIPILTLQEIESLPVLLNNNFFLLTTIVLVILSSHLATQIRFREFSARYNLAKANEELKNLDNLKSQFFANVSHEVRTPLTSILSPIQSLYHGDMGDLSPEQQRLIGQMYRNSLKLLDMINQMLDFSRFEAGKMQLRLGKCDLDETVRDIVAIFEDVAERKGIRLRYIADSRPEPFYLDPDKIERILTNLIRNAIKFTEKGHITVRAGGNHDAAYLEVEDTGIGIPKEHLPNIFKRFQQVDGSSTRKFEGTGLGLTIVREAVDLMRGTIEVFSDEGKGSRFRVEIPKNLEQLLPDAFVERRMTERRTVSLRYRGEDRRKTNRRKDDLARVSVDEMALIERELLESPEEAAGVSPRPGKGTKRVLLVEDNADLRVYVSKMLARFGHTVITALDGLDGWHQARAETPDIVVSDIMMPRMDGYELVNRIKTDPKTQHIPIILVTAKPELESKIQGLKIGADDYLTKPINIRELDARIKNLLTTRQFQLALAREEELKRRMEELSMSFSQSLEIRDFQTAGHSRDVLDLGLMMAQEVGLPADHVLRDSLLLHDIGKLGIPDRILLKSTALDPEEWQIMKRHPEIGAGLLGHFDSYKEVSKVVLAHQEHFDGSGYPQGLKGQEIPLYARIIAITDAYHAMTSDRPYRKALSPATAARELLKHSGTQFDPHLVEAFIRGLRARGELKEKDLIQQV